MWRGRKKSDPPETRHARTAARGGPDATCELRAVCHLRPATPTARGRDTRHISHHDITPDTPTRTAFYSHGFGLNIHTRNSHLSSNSGDEVVDTPNS